MIRQGVWQLDESTFERSVEALSSDRSAAGVASGAPVGGSVLYWPSDQDSPEVRRVLVGMAPYSGYVTVPGHRSEGGLDMEEFGVLFGQELA